MVRMHWNNKKLLFPEYRGITSFYLVFSMIRYCMFFQVLFYSVMGNFFFLGSMDHLMSRSSIVSATNKDSINIGRCTALWDVMKFNTGSWTLSLYIIGLSYAVWMHTIGWDYTTIPFHPTEEDEAKQLLVAMSLNKTLETVQDEDFREQLDVAIFCLPATFMALMAFIIPLLLNPFVLGWPFNPPLWCCRKKKSPDTSTKILNKNPRDLKSSTGGKVVDLKTFMNDNAANKVEREANRVAVKPDVELGSLATREVLSPQANRLSANGLGRNSRLVHQQVSSQRPSQPTNKAMI
jgi:hypothetical protein